MLNCLTPEYSEFWRDNWSDDMRQDEFYSKLQGSFNFRSLARDLTRESASRNDWIRVLLSQN